jgi:hypothetical protein
MELFIQAISALCKSEIMIASEKHNYCRKPNTRNNRSVGAELLYTAIAVDLKLPLSRSVGAKLQHL